MQNHQYVREFHPTLNHPDRQAIGTILGAVLIDLIDLALLTEQARWSGNGPRCQSLHVHLDELVDDSRDLADRVAERAVVLGVVPDGQVRTVADRTQIPPLSAKPLPDHELLSALTARVVGLIYRVRTAMEQVAEHDRVTEGLLVDAVAVLEKQLRILRASDDVPIAVEAGDRVLIRRSSRGW
jgi:starvation-inducible DNA-binding protein